MPETVLITGGAGFIGSHLAKRFVDDGHRVVILDALIEQVHGAVPEEESALLRSVSQIATVIKGSVTSTDDLKRALKDATVVVHLAAETGTGQSMYEIERYVDTNIGGTAKLLDLLTNTENLVKRVVIASSRSIYGEGSYRTKDGRIVFPTHRSPEAMERGRFELEDELTGEPLEMIPTSETAVIHPSSVYGITKQAQESLVMTVGPAIGIDAVALRYQNVYGPGQSLKNPYTGILSIFSTLIRKGSEINVFEDGRESRDFVYIDDVVEATYLAALSPDAAGRILNVGSGVATSVTDVVEALTSEFGVTVPVRVSGNYRIGDIRHNVADTELLARVLGFTPAVPFREGVHRFVEWVKNEPVEEDRYQKSLAEMSSRNLFK